VIIVGDNVGDVVVYSENKSVTGCDWRTVPHGFSACSTSLQELNLH